MRIGLFTALYSQLTLDQVIEKVQPLGIRCLELGAVNYATAAHVKLEWLSAPAKLNDLKQKLEDHGITISALTSAGNSLHPNPKIGKKCAEVTRKVIRLAEKMGVTRVIDFSGCPGDSERAKYPNWVATPWPPD